MIDDEILKDEYYNVFNGLKSKNKFYQYLQKKYKEITLKEVGNFLDKQGLNQVFKKGDDKNRYNPVITKRLGEINIDLISMDFFKSENKGYKYIVF